MSTAPRLYAAALSIGRVAFALRGNALQRLYLPNEVPAGALLDAAHAPATDAALAAAVVQQMKEYLAAERRRFTLPLALPPMTLFAARTMAAMLAIPYGETRHYAQLGAARAVGTVCARNPLPLIYPCHRVLPAAGGIGAYRGGTALKEFLLNLEHRTIEQAESNGNRQLDIPPPFGY